MKIIAVDIGGTEIKGSLMNPNTLKSHRVQTDLQKGKTTILASLYRVIEALMDDDVQAISIVTAGTIDTENTTIIANMGTMPGWLHLNLGETVKERYDLPVFVDNDANGAMLGEIQEYHQQGIQNAVMITLGTGVGTALFLNGSLYRGPFYKVEFGHMILHPEGTQCTCGRLGCVEQYVSGSALTRAAQNFVDANITHGSELFDYLEKNDLQAQKVWQKYLKDLALFIQNINQIIDPEVFILGGGVIKNHAVLLPALQEALRFYEMEKPIVAAKYGNEAGIRGAYYYALERLLPHG
jgi:glucokinase